MHPRFKQRIQRMQIYVPSNWGRTAGMSFSLLLEEVEQLRTLAWCRILWPESPYRFHPTNAESTLRDWLEELSLFPETCILDAPRATLKFQNASAELIRGGRGLSADAAKDLRRSLHIPPGCRGERHQHCIMVCIEGSTFAECHRKRLRAAKGEKVSLTALPRNW